MELVHLNINDDAIDDDSSLHYYNLIMKKVPEPIFNHFNEI